MTTDQEPMPNLPSLRELQDLATNEQWDQIDAVIGDAAKDPAYLVWATDGMKDEDGNLRDLAVSLFEKSPDELPPAVSEDLQQLMQTDENPYVRFRAAFTLFGHGHHEPSVVDMLKVALKDKDVAEISQSYLDQIDEQK